MRRVTWTATARREVVEIRDYIAKYDPGAAAGVASRLIAAGNSLADYPDRGRPLTSQLRELVSGHDYLIRYRVQADTVQILGVRHTARRPVRP